MSKDSSSSPQRCKPADILVFWLINDSKCDECGRELGSGNFLRLEEGRPLCLGCADLDHLVFLASGDTALTRRASKHSTMRCVVLKFSRHRKRYERQGILMEEAALEQAERECLADEEARARARQRAAERRFELDAEYIEAFARRVRELFPGCPDEEGRAIAEHACLKHSGRVGRSAAAKRLEDEPILLAVRARIRHRLTRYDRLLMSGIERAEARAEVEGEVEEVITRWSAGPSADSRP